MYFDCTYAQDSYTLVFSYKTCYILYLGKKEQKTHSVCVGSRFANWALDNKAGCAGSSNRNVFWFFVRAGRAGRAGLLYLGIQIESLSDILSEKERRKNSLCLRGYSFWYLNIAICRRLCMHIWWKCTIIYRASRNRIIWSLINIIVCGPSTWATEYFSATSTHLKCVMNAIIS